MTAAAARRRPPARARTTRRACPRSRARRSSSWRRCRRRRPAPSSGGRRESVRRIRRDVERHPGRAGVQVSIDVARSSQSVDHDEALRRLEAADQLAALGGPILIDDDQRNVAHIRRRRIAKHRQLNDRRDDDDAEEARILPQLQELLANDVQASRVITPIAV